MAQIEIKLSDDDLHRLADLVANRIRAPEQPKKLLWSEKEAADILGVSAYFLKDARHNGRIVAHSNKRPVSYTWEQIESIKRWLGCREGEE